MNFTDEIKEYSIDDLELIIATQKELYTEEEMELLKQQLRDCYKKEEEAKKARILANLPESIPCQKCGGPNAFDNIVCNYCGAKLDKKRFYIDPNDQAEEDQAETSKEDAVGGDGYGFHYFISFLIPLIGFILGAVMLGNGDEERQSAGKACIIIGVVSCVITAIIYGIAFAT